MSVAEIDSCALTLRDNMITKYGLGGIDRYDHHCHQLVVRARGPGPWPGPRAQGPDNI